MSVGSPRLTMQGTSVGQPPTTNEEDPMRYTVEDIPVEMELGEIATRGVECGELYTRHIRLPGGTDFTPLLVGLPGDLCQCAHWGQVLEESITVRYADGHEET